MVGLRLLREGVNASAFAARYDATLDQIYGETIQDLIAIGMLERTDDGVRLTARGLMLANDVAARFLA